MKVLFANPAYRMDLGNGFERYFFCAGSRCPWSLIKPAADLPRYAMFPFFMGYAAALLEKDSFEVEALDAVPLNLSLDEFMQRAVQATPDMIVLEPATTSFVWVLGIASQLKRETAATIVLAGPHASVLAAGTLEENPFVDYILIGEYEHNLHALARALAGKTEIGTLQGIAWRSRENTIEVRPDPAPTDPDSLPMPARHLFPAKGQTGMHYYHDGFCQNRPAVQLHSSRGCPFTCNFCLWTQTMYKPGRYRIRTATAVVDEMEYVAAHFGAKEVYFDDDTFTGSKSHVMGICEEILRRNLRIPWSVMGDAIKADEEMLYKMKEAGCIGIKFGMESGDPEILKNINKPLHLNRLESLLKVCTRLGMKTHVSVSFGHIGETEATLRRTMKYASKLDTDSIQFSLATPYPGTRFYAEVVAQGMLAATTWEDYDPTHNPIVQLPGVSREVLKHTESKAHGTWLRHKVLKPAWLYRQAGFLLYILRRQGIGGLFSRLKRAYDILFIPKFR